MSTTSLFVRLRPAPRRRFARWQAIWGWVFILPWLAGFVLLRLAPILASLVFSFTNFHMLHPDQIRFVGLANYAALLRDENAGFTLFSTIGFALISVPLQLLV